jgi:hypothetical protein
MFTTQETMSLIRRLQLIEAKYSTEKGATEEERQEAQDIVETLLVRSIAQFRGR